MLDFIRNIFKRKNVFDNVVNKKQVKIMPRPQLEKVLAIGEGGNLIEGNIVSILCQNLLDLREICEYIIVYKNDGEKLALDEAIQHLAHMLERPENYAGFVEYRNEDANV
tara:strand:- start:74501 stop:74830 length:330 start_codon:yes stop_codon:yes gene_type:complete